MTAHLTGPVPSTAGQRRARRSRRVGYALTVAVDAVLLWLLLVEPGWQSIGFLTADAAAVVGPVSACIAVGLLANLVWLVADPPWLRSGLQLLVTALSLWALVALVTVFPFDLGTWPAWLGWVLRGVLALAALGTALGLVVEAVRLVRALAQPPPT